jgi:hypothetical protein
MMQVTRPFILSVRKELSQILVNQDRVKKQWQIARPAG